MRKDQIYLSTIASDAVRLAKEYGVNLEIAEYCTVMWASMTAIWKRFAGGRQVHRVGQSSTVLKTENSPWRRT